MSGSTLGRGARAAGAAALAIACMLHASPAGATGATCTEGAFARTVGERMLIAWDPQTKTEHVIVQVRFQSDAAAHAFVMPMPQPPLATGGYSIEDEILFGRLESLMRYEPHEIPDAPELDALPQSTARTVMGTVLPQPSALGDWLQQEKLTARPSLTAWASRYEKRGWTLNAVRLANDDVPENTARVVQSPPVRFSFQTDAPYVPYTESPPDGDEEFAKKHGKPIVARSMDVWVVAPTPVALVREGTTKRAEALVRKTSTRVSGRELDTNVGAIGPFDPKSRPAWYVTRFAERGKGPRVAFEDLTIVEAARTDSHPDAKKPRLSPRTKALGALGLLLAVAAGLAFLSQRDER